MTIKGVKLRLYPNVKQRDQLLQMFGNDRFVWNQMLAMAKEHKHDANKYDRRKTKQSLSELTKDI